MLQDDDAREAILNSMLLNDLAAYLISDGDMAAFARYALGNYDSSGDHWRIYKDEQGNVTQVLYDGDYTHATIVEADGTETTVALDPGSVRTALAKAVGNGMDPMDMQDIMIKSGLGYNDETKHWFAEDKRAIYTPPSQNFEAAQTEEALYAGIFGEGWVSANDLFDRFKTNPNLERIAISKVSMEEIQAMADNGALILLSYQDPNPKKHGHIAFIANSRLTLSTSWHSSSPEPLHEGKRGTEINHDDFWPVVAQSGVYTGITSTLYATTGYRDPDIRSRLLRESLYFYTVKRSAQ
jgi:hypothetical protein